MMAAGRSCVRSCSRTSSAEECCWNRRGAELERVRDLRRARRGDRRPTRSRRHRVDLEVGRTCAPPSLDVIEDHVETALGCPAHPALHPDRRGSRPASRPPLRRSPSPPRGVGPGGTSGTIRRRGGRHAGTRGRRAPNQIGIGRWTGSGAIPAPVTCSERPVERHRALGPQPAQQRRSARRCARPRSPKLLPSASYSTGFQPTPTPSRNRPPTRCRPRPPASPRARSGVAGG